MNEKLLSSLIMVDLRKAFDTVCHKKLLKKLDHYGIHGIVNELISDYVLNRKQYVDLNGVRSSLQPINIGVPQGSILGPLLYLIYVNDLPHCLECTPSLYVDDTCMIVHNQRLSELEGKVCKNISDLKVWLDSNKLTLNFNKTACMLISPYTHSRNIIFNPMINEKLLKVVTSYKYLGITVDNQLNFINHIKNLQKKIASGVGVLWKLKKFLPLDTLLLLYYVLIQPHILYAIIICGSTCSAYKNRLRTLQNSAIRAIANVRKMQRISLNYCKCSILKLDDLYRFETAKLLFQYTKNDFLKPFEHMFQQSSHTHFYNTRSVTLKNYNIPSFKTARLQRSFQYQWDKYLE